MRKPARSYKSRFLYTSSARSAPAGRLEMTFHWGARCLRWFRRRFPLVPLALLPYSQLKMQDRTETLEIGSRAPEFALPSANWEGSIFTLSTMLGRGPVIVEFLRGTW